jgi:hypothetical protein
MARQVCCVLKKSLPALQTKHELRERKHISTCKCQPASDCLKLRNVACPGYCWIPPSVQYINSLHQLVFGIQIDANYLNVHKLLHRRFEKETTAANEWDTVSTSPGKQLMGPFVNQGGVPKPSQPFESHGNLSHHWCTKLWPGQIWTHPLPILSWVAKWLQIQIYTRIPHLIYVLLQSYQLGCRCQKNGPSHLGICIFVSDVVNPIILI